MARSSSGFQLSRSIRVSRLWKAVVALVAVLCGLLLAGPSLNAVSSARAAAPNVICVVDTYRHNPADGTDGCPAGQYPYGVIDYLAMGDSYSAGESVPPFETDNFEGKDSLTDRCDRSDLAASAVLAARLPSTSLNVLGVDRQFIACSGATTDNLLDKSQNGERSQGAEQRDIQGGEFHKGADLITLTAGGNDIGFANIMMICLARNAAINTQHAEGKTVTVKSCGEDPVFDAEVNSVIADIPPVLQNAYRSVGQTAGPDASVLVAEYPQIFPASAAGQNCSQLQALLRPVALTEMRAWTTRLDTDIQIAAQGAGVHFVDVRPVFSGHAICDSGTSWINILVGHNGKSVVGLPAGAFHPKAQGQAGYATAYLNYINTWRRAGRPLTSVGLPQDTGIQLSQSAVSALRTGPSAGTAHLTLEAADDSSTDTLAMGNLAVSPTDGSACQTQFGAGESLHLSGDGYSPGAAVTLSLMPYLPGEIDYQLTADANGSIDTTIVLPTTLSPIALGTTDAGYLESNGPGATTTTRIDNNLFTIGDPSPTCGLPVLTGAKASLELTGSDTPYLDVAGATFAVDGPGLPPSAGAAAGTFAELDLDADDNTVCAAQEPAGVQCANGVLGGLTPDATYTVTQLTAAQGYAVAAPVSVTATEDDTVTEADVNDVAVSADYESGTTAASCLLCVLSGTGTSLSATGNSRVTWAGIGTSDSTSAAATTATGSSTLTGQVFFSSGGVKLTGTGHLTTGTPPAAGSTQDPFAWYHLPTQSGTGAVLSATGSQVVDAQPGVYSRITASGNARLTLEPGSYVVTGGRLSVTGSARLTASGATIYLACSGYPAPCTGSAGSGGRDLRGGRGQPDRRSGRTR